jgi:hypothetical protein
MGNGIIFASADSFPLPFRGKIDPGYNGFLLRKGKPYDRPDSSIPG